MRLGNRSAGSGILTAGSTPEVEAQGALQCLVGTPEGVEEEEAGGQRGEENQDTTEEDHRDVQAQGDHMVQTWEDWANRQ